MADDSTRDEAIQRWISAQLAQAPPITPQQAARLSDLLASARKPGGS